ncbi:MAG: quinol:cytochrome C oxidoreductase [Cyclobacteriaceae bacterium]
MADERFEFTAKAKKKLFILIGVGLALSVLGVIMINSGGHHGEEVAAAGDHGFHWTKRLFANIWINNVFFLGIAITGVFFFTIQYAAQAGWSAGIKRIPLAFGNWLPFAFGLLIVSFFAFGHDLFHWSHHSLYDPSSEDFDSIINGKKSYFFWPLQDHPSIPVFFIARMVIFFGVWYWLFMKLKKLAFAEDLEGGTDYWFRMRKTSAIFLVFFAVSSSMGAWDWVMSIDTHWFSTMFGWYVFASWWVTTLALITLIVVLLKDQGYLSVVNANHIHDLGKFVFAFSIFWTYIWFSQFMLIYYSNIPEETIYFVERWKDDHYAPVFFVNLILNFLLPFLLLMTRDSKRHTRFLKVVTPIVIFGHWIDFYLMIVPGTLKDNGGFGFLELGLLSVYLGAFLYVVLNALSKAPLVAKNHPMLKESLHHHI